MDHTVLLIEDDAITAKVIRRALADSREGPFDVEWVKCLSDALERLSQNGIQAVLLDLILPDSQGIETFERVLLAAPYVPILVLVGLENEDIARQAVHGGAQDYLLKGDLDSQSLARAIRNMIERKAAEEALFAEKERAQVTLNSIGDGVLSTDIAGNIVYLNQVAEKMTGWTLDEASGRPFREVLQIIEGATRELARNPMELAVQQNKTVNLTANCILIRRDGFEFAIEDSASPIYDREGGVSGAVIVFRDVSVARAIAFQMSHLAHYDLLTDLPNRILFDDRVNQAIELARRNGNQLAVLFLDLDRFKDINDSLGHAIGDKVLLKVAEWLLACVRRSDTVCRHGGDEFVVLLSEIDHAEHAALSVRKLLTALAMPLSISEHELHLNGSVGISIYPDDGQDAETLIKSADTAMYHAKRNGPNNFQFFKQDMNVRAAERK